MILFTKDMKLGVPHIDAQHRGLVDFANQVAALCAASPTKEEMKECLNFLGSYVVGHFNDEEALQIESKYPRYRQHKQIHEEFVQTFQSMCAEFEKRGVSEELTAALSGWVSGWIVTHIKMEDVTFGRHYTNIKKDRLKTYL